MKLHKNILIIILVIVLLAGALVLVNKLPDNEEEPKTEETQKTEYIDVFRVKTDDIKDIYVITPESSYTVSKNGKELSLSDSSNIKVNNQALSSFLNACSYVYAEKIVTEKEDDVSVYGFSNPLATVTISLKDGSKKELQIGNKTIDSSGNYIKLSDEDKIYIKSSYGISSLIPDYVSFIDKNVLKITSDKHKTLSLIRLSKPGNPDVELKSAIVKTEDSEGIKWEVTKPVFADVNTTILTNNFLTLLEAFSANGVAEKRVSDLSKYGLKNPYATLTISADGVTQKFTFGKEENGVRYFTVDNYATVYTASSAGLGFLNVSYIDLMSRLIHIENIKNVCTLEIKSADKNYVLKISGDERFINDKKIDKNVFSKVYQGIIGLRFDSIDLNKKASGRSEITLKYTKNDNTTHTVSFESVDDRNYLASVDGKGSSIITKKAVHDALDFIEEKLSEAK